MSNLRDVFKRRKQMTFIVESFFEKSSHTVNVSFEIPLGKNKKENLILYLFD